MKKLRSIISAENAEKWPVLNLEYVRILPIYVFPTARKCVSLIIIFFLSASFSLIFPFREREREREVCYE